MKFEDLFVKQRPPKDYVSYPPQETPTLEKFFQERTNKPVPQQIPIQVKAAPLDTTKLDPSSPVYTPPKKDIEIPEKEVEQIKQIYSPAPVQSPAPQMEQAPYQPSFQEQVSESMGRVPARSSIDLDAIRAEADGMTRKLTWEDALPALAPLAVEALFGPSRQGESFKIAGDYLVGEVGKEKARKQKLEDTLLAMEKSRLLKRNQKGMQLKSLRDKATGQPAIGSYDPSTDTMYVQGQPVDTAQFELAPGLSTEEFGRRQGIQSQTRIKEAEYLGKNGYVSPETGLRTIIRGGKPITIQEKQGGLDVKQQKDLVDVAKSFRSTDAYKKPLASLQAASAVEDLIEKGTKGNVSAIQFARKELAKMAEGGGKLSNEDVTMVGGSPSIPATARRYANLQKTGQVLTPEEVKDLREIADILYKVSEAKLRDSVAGLSKSFAQRAQLGEDIAKSYMETEMSAFIPSKPQIKQPLSFEEWKKKYGTKK